MSARNDFLAALKALLPPASDGTVSVVRAGELVTVSLTLPGREKPITTATVRAPKKGDSAQQDLFEARVPAPEAPAAPAETLAPVNVPEVVLPPRELSVGAGVHSEGSTWKVTAVEGDRVLLVLDVGHAHHPERLVLPRSAITLNEAEVWGFEQSPAWGDAGFDATYVKDPTSGKVAVAPAEHLGGPSSRRCSSTCTPTTLRQGRTPACLASRYTSQVSGGHLAGVSETPEHVDAEPEGKPWTLFSVEVPEREVGPRSWALRRGLAWCCGGFLIWGIEGGASKRGKHRMVAIVPSRNAHELLDLVDNASMIVNMVDLHYGDTLLRVGSFVRRNDGWRWPVTAIDRTTRMVTLERNGATVSVELGAIETTSDGTGDFEIVSTAPTTRRDEKPSEKPSKKSSAPKASKGSAPKRSEIMRGYVELRVSEADFAKNRKGLLANASQPLGGIWQQLTGGIVAARVGASGNNARRVLSYCNHKGIKLAVEGSPTDVANAMGPDAPTEATPTAETAAERLPRAVLSELKVNQAVRVATSAAGIDGVPVTLAGETCVVVKIGPKKVTVYCRKLGRSYAVPADSLEVLPVAVGGAA